MEEQVEEHHTCATKSQPAEGCSKEALTEDRAGTEGGQDDMPVSRGGQGSDKTSE